MKAVAVLPLWLVSAAGWAFWVTFHRLTGGLSIPNEEQPCPTP